MRLMVEYYDEGQWGLGAHPCNFTFPTGLGLKHSKCVWQRLSQVINSGSLLASYASVQLSMEVMVHL